MATSLTAFAFTPAMGRKLRQLRKRAGLSLQEVAHMMGHSLRFCSHLSKLELGKLHNPSMGLVAGFLRACSASFADLLPLLAEYTNRPPLRDAPVEEKVKAELAPLGGWESVRLWVYDQKRKGQLTADGRVSAAKRQAKAAAERRLLDRLMRDEVNRLGVPPTSTVRLVAHDYARMVWRALELTKPRPRKKLGRPPKTRKQRLAEARARIRQLAPRVLPVRALKQIEGKVVFLFEDLHRFEKPS